MEHPTPSVSSQTPTTVARSNGRLRMLVVAFAVLVLVVGCTAWLLSATYLTRSESAVVKVFAPMLPAAKVGAHVIPYSEFLDTRATLRVYLVSQPAKDSGLAQELTSDLEKNAFQRLVRERIVEDIAAERNVVVTDEDIRSAFSELVLSTSSTIPNVAQYLDETFKWTEEEFRARVIRPQLVETRVAESFAGATGTDVDPEQMDRGYGLLEEEIKKREASPDVKTYLRF